MNTLLFTQAHYLDASTIRLDTRQVNHLRRVLRAQPGDELKVGEMNGKLGTGTLLSLGDRSATVQINRLDREPPAALPATLVIGLPRPKMTKRILQCATAMGVKQFHFFHCYKVEKSFWSSPWLTPEKIHENLVLGLEQAGDTVLPEVHLHQRFKPFVEDELPALSKNTLKLVAHPYVADDCPALVNQPSTIVIGPEGGLIPYEVDKLLTQGFHAIRMGERVLRVETAVPALLARLFDFS